MLHKQYGKEWLMGRYYIRYHMVTHFVTILKIAGIGVSSGKRVVLKLKGEGAYDVLGRLSFGSSGRWWHIDI
jgi:hypothetical protein